MERVMTSKKLFVLIITIMMIASCFLAITENTYATKKPVTKVYLKSATWSKSTKKLTINYKVSKRKPDVIYFIAYRKGITTCKGTTTSLKASGKYTKKGNQSLSKLIRKKPKAVWVEQFKLDGKWYLGVGSVDVKTVK